jgi:hypothetical protein
VEAQGSPCEICCEQSSTRAGFPQTPGFSAASYRSISSLYYPVIRGWLKLQSHPTPTASRRTLTTHLQILWILMCGALPPCPHILFNFCYIGSLIQQHLSLALLILSHVMECVYMFVSWKWSNLSQYRQGA